MTKRIVSLLILAEDLRAANFLRRYAEKIVHPRRIRVEIAPPGRGAGEQYVREKYPVEARQQRLEIRAGLRNSALVVHVDADVQDVSHEHQLLATALQADNQPARTNMERIAIVVPKRNTETWVHGLSGVETDEDYDYKRDKEHLIAPNAAARKSLLNQRSHSASEELFQLTRNNAPPPPANMPSLIAAIPELRRLE